MDKPIRNPADHGSAIVLVLITVALFGALGYTLMKGAKTGQGDFASHQTRLSTQDLVDFAGQMQRAVSKLMAHGCSEGQINFVSGLYPSANASAPIDQSCDVFSSQGAGAIAQTFTPPATSVVFSAIDNLSGTATAAPDLALYMTGLPTATCLEINRLLGIDNPATIPNDTTSTSGLTAYVGIFPGSAAAPYNDDDVRTQNKKSACVHAGGTNIFYTVLIDR